jgi:uncharacterized protein YdeI (YjbR/CyaY-like superfamily)
MNKRGMNPRVDFFFKEKSRWQKEYAELRKICLGAGLNEELKWGVPCYGLDQKNIVLIHGFKDYCALLFFKGALLKDEKAILIRQTKNVQSARQARFKAWGEILKLKATLKSYILEAIENEKAGLKVRLKKVSEFDMPAEFNIQLEKSVKLKAAFHKLTPGRQRAYLLFFSAAKQAGTREARVKKSIPGILEGKGLND